ncbi:MAG: hypothetical protein PWR29_1812 [Methanolobus sp.]|jgi:hypothetical protein|nr:hypothetical protein [Methanolobus sp.]MDK2912855.1 hypothetical protein [Methanolobus sp.]MDN5309959.1 hypothetical protein [Methanolobus sp.]
MGLGSKNLSTSSFTSDEKAFMEPHNDIISTAMVVIGFVIFAALISKTYFAYDDNSLALENYRQAALIASDIAAYPPIQGSRQDLISADALDAISIPAADREMHTEFFRRFSANLDFTVEIRTDDGSHMWMIDRHETPSSDNDIIAASVPVVIELGNNALCVPGTVTVRLRKNRWI